MKKLPLMILAALVVLFGAVTVFVTSTGSIEWKEEDLHAFVQKEIKDISRETFDAQWQILYFDVTGDGELEAILAEDYVMDWHPYVEVVSKADRRYERIPSQIHAGKYGTEIQANDDFLLVTMRTGGPGEQLAYLSLYVHTSTGMAAVLEDLLVHQRVAFPAHDFEVTGEITGDFSDFEYRQVKYDYLTDEETIELVQSYQYNPDERRF